MRIDKAGRTGQKQGAFHVKCVFDTSLGGGELGTDIQVSSDLPGWEDLAAEDKEIVEGYITQNIARNSNNTSTVTSINTNSLPSTSPTSVPSTSRDVSLGTRQQGKRKHSTHVVVLSDSDSESDVPTLPPLKSPHLSPPPPTPVLPNMLEGVTIPEGPPRTYDECCVCLDPPVHPVTLPCSHIYCYLCAKGLTRQAGQLATCSLCRKDIPDGYLESAQVLAKATIDMNDTPPLLEDEEPEWQWFYKGRNGWWRFEERTNEELEETFTSGKMELETLICGNLYIIDFVNLEQFQKSFPTRKRKIKRDLRNSHCKGVAGLQKRKWSTL